MPRLVLVPALKYLNVEILLLLSTCMLVAEHVVHVSLPVTAYIVVPAATWAVYTIDRLVDSRTTTLTTGRHTFHRRNARWLIPTAGVSLLMAAVLAALSFPATFWIAGGVVGLWTVLHIPLQRSHRKRWAVVKDLNVGVVFTVAAWILPLTQWWTSGSGVSVLEWLPMFGIMLCTIVMDILFLSQLDYNHDEQQRLPSIAVALGWSTMRRLQFLLLALILAISVIMSITTDQPLRAFIAALPALLYSAARFSGPVDLQRVVLELVPTLWILILWT